LNISKSRTFDHAVGQSQQRTAADAGSDQVLDFTFRRAHDRRAGSHADHDRFTQADTNSPPRPIARNSAVLTVLRPEQVAAHIGCADAGHHDTLDRLESRLFWLRNLPSAPKARTHRITRLDPFLADQAAVFQADNFRGAASEVQSDHDAHGASPLSNHQIIAQICT
jgi:hypothetical protein